MGEHYSKKELGKDMYQFFIEDENAAEDFVTIEGSDVNHIKNVLRMKPGEKIRVCTRNGQNYFCSISDITESFVRADILEKEAESTELPCRIYLFQGLPKNDKMEWIIQKTVELGVYEVIPVAMKNCVVKLDDKKAKSKVTRCIRRRKQQSSWRRRPPCGRWQEPRRSRYRFRCPDSCAC